MQKKLHPVNLKTQENWQRDTILTPIKLNATLINPLKLNQQSLKIRKKQCPNTNAVPAGVVCYCLKMRKKTKYHNTNGIVQVLKIRKKAWIALRLHLDNRFNLLAGTWRQQRRHQSTRPPHSPSKKKTKERRGKTDSEICLITLPYEIKHTRFDHGWRRTFPEQTLQSPSRERICCDRQ
jgi:hypothetical protein